MKVVDIIGDLQSVLLLSTAYYCIYSTQHCIALYYTVLQTKGRNDTLYYNVDMCNTLAYMAVPVAVIIANTERK